MEILLFICGWVVLIFAGVIVTISMEPSNPSVVRSIQKQKKMQELDKTKMVELKRPFKRDMWV